VITKGYAEWGERCVERFLGMCAFALVERDSADEVFGGYSWYPPMAGADGLGTDEYARVFFDRGHEDLAEFLAEEHLVGEDVSRAFVDEHVSRPGADTPLDRALPPHEVVELAATCPPELKLARGGKGELKDAARRLLPGDVIDRPEGYFSVPALSHLEGPVLDLVRDALTSPPARGLFRPEYVDALLAAPHEARTNLDGSELWQRGLLGLWLQEQGL
jgi:asparagine synthase (glutamine-hydrolysing)